MVLYTEKYILASHSNLKIADSRYTDKETETQEDWRIRQEISVHSRSENKIFPDWALCYKQKL